MKNTKINETKDRLLEKGIFPIRDITTASMRELTDWILTNRPDRKEFTILISSGGGIATPVISFASNISILSKDVVIHGVACNICNSAAIALLQCCHKRSAIKHTSFMIHHLQSSITIKHYFHEKSKIEEMLEYNKNIEDEIVDLQCNRTGISRSDWMKLADAGERDPATLIFTKQALKLGLIDEILDSYPCL
jgi:ATP-dependent protease ClpP protease subunit